MLKRLFFATTLLITAFYADAQMEEAGFDYTHKIPAVLLQEDLRILKDSLELRHPALYRYTRKGDLDRAFSKALALLDKPFTQAEFYGIVAPLIGLVGDIHTNIEPSDESLGYIASKSALFPFDVRIIKEQLFIVSNNSSDTSIATGSRVLSINNSPASEVLAKMKNVFSDEGHNETLKNRRVEQRFTFLYHLLFGYVPTFTIELAKDSQKQTRTVDAQPFSYIRQARSKNQVKHPELRALFVQPPYLGLSINKDNSTAFLTIKSFEDDLLTGTGQPFNYFIDSAFNEISSQKIRNLVIDIRGNEGGQSGNATYLYSYVSGKPFRFLESMETTRSTWTEDRQRGIRYDTAGGRYLTSDSTTGLQQFFGFELQPARVNAFTGNLYVLVNGLTTSAAPQFVSLIRLNKRGVIIGEQVPGSLYGGSGRGYSYFYLPNSGLLTMISRYRLHFASPRDGKDRNIEPDYKSGWSINDILNGRDKDIELALQLIEKKNLR